MGLSFPPGAQGCMVSEKLSGLLGLSSSSGPSWTRWRFLKTWSQGNMSSPSDGTTRQRHKFGMLAQMFTWCKFMTEGSICWVPCELNIVVCGAIIAVLYFLPLVLSPIGGTIVDTHCSLRPIKGKMCHKKHFESLGCAVLLGLTKCITLLTHITLHTTNGQICPCEKRFTLGEIIQ